MNYDDTKFIKMLKTFGVKRTLCSVDLICSLTVSVFLIIIIHHFNIAAEDLIKLICPLYITISAAMIAIAIAGLAIVASISDLKFVSILKSVGIYKNILFVFWYSTMVSAASIIINIVTYILLLAQFNPIFYKAIIINSGQIYFILLFVSTLLALYSVFVVISIVGLTMRYGLYRCEFASEEAEQSNVAK